MINRKTKTKSSISRVFTFRQVEYAYQQIQQNIEGVYSPDFCLAIVGILDLIRNEHIVISEKLEKINEPYVEEQSRYVRSLPDVQLKLHIEGKLDLPQPLRILSAKVSAEIASYLDKNKVTFLFVPLSRSIFKDKISIALAQSLMPFIDE